MRTKKISNSNSPKIYKQFRIIMENKHTDGKWEIQLPKGVIASTRIHSNNATIATVHAIDEMEANAQLIAAAPELLEVAIIAKRLIAELWDLDTQYRKGVWTEYNNKIREVIEKATQG